MGSTNQVPTPGAAGSARSWSAAPTVPTLLLRARAVLITLPIANVVETMRPLPVRPIRMAPPFVRGIAIVRGEPLPVIDLGALLTKEVSVDGPESRFVTVTSGDRRVSLAVAAVVGVRAINLDALAATPPLVRDALPEQIDRIGVLDGELLGLLDAARLLPREALRALELSPSTGPRSGG